MSNLCAFFVTAHLYEHTTTDNEPDFGEMDDIISFFRDLTSGGGRGVACNAPTIDVPIDLLIAIFPWKGVIPAGITQQIVFRPSFNMVREGRILHFISGYRRLEFPDIIYDEKSC